MLFPDRDLDSQGTFCWSSLIYFSYGILMYILLVNGKSSNRIIYDKGEQLSQTSLSTQSHLTTCYASRPYAYKTGKVISAEGIGQAYLLSFLKGVVIQLSRPTLICKGYLFTAREQAREFYDWANRVHLGMVHSNAEKKREEPFYQKKHEVVSMHFYH